MKAITVHQPWATLIALGAKEYETRSWKPFNNLIGQLIAIHAGKAWTHSHIAYLHRDPFKACLAGHLHPNYTLPLGCIVAVCRLEGAFRSEELFPRLSDQERAFGNYNPHRWGWQLSVVKRFDAPIPCRGMQGIWNWEPSSPVAESLKASLDLNGSLVTQGQLI